MSPPGLRVAAKAARADTRSTNRRLVLQHLFDGHVLSRADLARATDLTPATVSTLVGELASEGLVVEAPAPPSGQRVGKPPTFLQLSFDARCVVAADLSDPETLRAGIVDLAGAVTNTVEVPLRGATGRAAVTLVTTLIEQAMAMAPSPILGIGIAAPGVVSGGDTVVEATRFGLCGAQLKDLSATTSLPVVVTSNAHASAIAEYSRGGHDSAHLAVITIGSRVGAGFVLNGQPFEGQHAGAGEIGHLVVDPTGPLCQCGHHGCLETYAAVPSIVAAFDRDGATPEAVLAEAAHQLGVALAGVVSILDVARIIVAGPQTLLGDDFCSNAVTSMRERCLPNVAGSVDVRYTSLGDDVVLLGAAALVVSKQLGVA